MKQNISYYPNKSKNNLLSEKELFVLHQYYNVIKINEPDLNSYFRTFFIVSDIQNLTERFYIFGVKIIYEHSFNINYFSFNAFKKT